MNAIQRLRLWINDKDSEIFSDDDLEEILSWHSDSSEQIDLARADCLEMIATDIKRWNSYSVGGQSETINKTELLLTVDKIRRRHGFKGGRL